MAQGELGRWVIGQDHAAALTGFAQLFECQELERLQGMIAEMIAQEDAGDPKRIGGDDDRIGFERTREEIGEWNQGVEKCRMGLLTPSLLPVACVESTV